MFEHRTHPLLPRHRFLLRMLRMSTVGVLTLTCSLGVGIAGYHYFEGMPMVDAFANAAMILSGMGPLTQLNTTGGKLFAGLYALFSGLTFITVVGVILAPVAHRLFHRFHIELDDEAGVIPSRLNRPHSNQE